MSMDYCQQTACLVRLYLIESCPDEVQLAFAEHNDYLDANDITVPSIPLEKLVEEYYKICGLVLQCINRVPPEDKPRWVKLDYSERLKCLLGLSGGESSRPQSQKSQMKRRMSMVVERRYLQYEDDDEEDDHQDEKSVTKRRRMDSSQNDVHSQPAADRRSFTSKSSNPLPTSEAPHHQRVSLADRQTNTNSSENPSPANNESLNSTETSSASTVVTANHQPAIPDRCHSPQYDLPAQERLSLGAHLSPIPSTSGFNHAAAADSFRLALLDHDEFQETLASNINKIIAPVDHQQQQQHQQNNNNTQRQEELDVQKMQDIVSLTEKDPIWDELIQVLVETGAVAASSSIAAPTAMNDDKKSLQMNKSIPGSLSSSTPQKKTKKPKPLKIPIAGKEPQANNSKTARAKRTELTDLKESEMVATLDAAASSPEKDDSVPTRRVLRPRAVKLKAKLPKMCFTPQKHWREVEKAKKKSARMKSYTEKRNNSSQAEAAADPPPTEIQVKVNIIGNERYQGDTPIIQYLDPQMELMDGNSNGQYLYMNPQMHPYSQQSQLQGSGENHPSTSTHQKLVIKPPPNCYYPQFNTQPIAVPVPIPQDSLEPQVEYYIQMPTPSKDLNNDTDITFGDSLSKVLIPHSTRRRRSRQSDEQSEQEEEDALEKRREGVDGQNGAETEKNVSTDKENSVPKILTRTPQLTSLVNRKVQCSSTPRKSHVRALFNTPRKNALQSPRLPNTLPKMDGHLQGGMLTPVTCLDRLEGRGDQLTVTRSAILTRSVKKGEIDGETSRKVVKNLLTTKEAITPRVPKAIKKRILGDVAKEKEQQDKLKEKMQLQLDERAKTQQSELQDNKDQKPQDKKKPKAKAVKKKAQKEESVSSLNDVSTKSTESETQSKPAVAKGKSGKKAPAKEKVVKSPVKKKKKTPVKAPKRSRAAKAAKAVEIEPEPEPVKPKSELEKWNELRKGDWESILREQMSQLPAPPKVKKPGKVKRGKKKGEEEEEQEANVPDGEKIAGGDEVEKDCSLTRECNKFLDLSQGDESRVADQTTITDTSRLEDTTTGGLAGGAFLPNLEASTVKIDNLNKSANLDESNKMDISSAVGGNQLPNLNPVTPGPVRTTAERVSEMQTVPDSTRNSSQEESSCSQLDKTNADSNLPNQSDLKANEMSTNVIPAPVAPLLPPIVTALSAQQRDDHLTKALSPKKRILHKTRSTERQLLHESSVNSPVVVVTAANTSHISPPSTSTSFNHSKLVHESHLFMETPFKGGLDIIPKTPGFAIPHQTPAAKIFKTAIDQQVVSVLKCPEIPTPDFAITPGVKLTPEKFDSTAKRPTDYSSSGSSYYKPDDSEETKSIEARLTTEMKRWKRKSESEAVLMNNGGQKILIEKSEVTVISSETTVCQIEKRTLDGDVSGNEKVGELREGNDSSPVNQRIHHDESSSSTSSDSSSSSYSSSGSSNTSSSDSEMEISDAESQAEGRPVRGGRKLIAENGELDEHNQIRFSRRSVSMTPRKSSRTSTAVTSIPVEDVKMQSPKVTSSSGGGSSSQSDRQRKASTKMNQNAQLMCELLEKKRRMAEKLKNGTPMKKPSRSKVAAVAKTVQQKPTRWTASATSSKENVAEIAVEKAVEQPPARPAETITTTTSVAMASSAKRKSSTPRKMILNGSGEVVNFGPGTAVKSTSTGNLAQQDTTKGKKEGIQKVYQNFFGDFSDSETDPTPVKRGDEKELFQTPKVEEKFMREKRTSGGEKGGEVGEKKKIEPRKSSGGSHEEKGKPQSDQRSELRSRKKTAVAEEQVAEAEDAGKSSKLQQQQEKNQEEKSANRSRSSSRVEQMKTPEAQVVKKRRGDKEEAVVEKEVAKGEPEEGESSKKVEKNSRSKEAAINSRSKEAESESKLSNALKSKDTKPSNSAPPARVSLNPTPACSTLKVSGRGVPKVTRKTIALDELPREGALDRKKGRATTKAVSVAIEKAVAEKPKMTAITDYFRRNPTAAVPPAILVAGGDVIAKPAVFRIPKTKEAKAREDGEIPEEEVAVARVSEIPEEEGEGSSSQQRQRGNKKATSTNSKGESEERVRSDSRRRREKDEEEEKRDDKKDRRRDGGRSSERSTRGKSTNSKEKTERRRKEDMDRERQSERKDQERDREQRTKSSGNDDLEAKKSSSKSAKEEEKRETTSRNEPISKETMESVSSQEAKESVSSKQAEENVSSKQAEENVSSKQAILAEDSEKVSSAASEVEAQGEPSQPRREDEILTQQPSMEEQQLDDENVDIDDDSGSEIYAENEMVMFDENSPNFFHVEHDPTYVPESSEPVKFNPDYSMTVNLGDGYRTLSMSQTFELCIPSTATGEAVMDKEEGKKKRNAPGVASTAATSSSAGQISSPLISLPKLGDKVVNNVLDYLHPERK